MFKEILSFLQSCPGTVYSVAVAEDGIRQTAFPVPSSRSHNSYSVTKVFTAVAMMMLADRGLLNPDDRIYPILKKYFPENHDPHWHEVTIADAMLHRTGLAEPGFLDIDGIPMDQFPSDDFLSIVLSQPLPGQPEHRYVYTDAAYYLLSRIFTECSGRKMDDFLRQELLNPLHFQEYAFALCPQGYPMGGTGLYISAEDTVKLGQLFLQNGVWEGRQILSPKAADEILTKGFGLYPCRDNGSFSKQGMYGQILYFNPRTQRAVAVQAYDLPLPPILEFLHQNDRA